MNTRKNLENTVKTLLGGVIVRASGKQTRRKPNAYAMFVKKMFQQMKNMDIPATQKMQICAREWAKLKR